MARFSINRVDATDELTAVSIINVEIDRTTIAIHLSGGTTIHVEAFDFNDPETGEIGAVLGFEKERS